MSQDSEIGDLQKWAAKLKFKWPTVTFEDQESTMLTKYAARSVPHYILIDKTGRRLALGLEDVFLKMKSL